CLPADGGNENDSLRHIDEHCAVRLARHRAGFHSYLVFTVLKRLFDSFHSFTRDRNKNGAEGWQYRDSGSYNCRAADAQSRTRADPSVQSSPVAPLVVLAAETEPIDQLAVPVRVPGFQVVKQLPPLVHHFQKTLPGMMVLYVLAKMPGKLGDACRQQRNLY